MEGTKQGTVPQAQQHAMEAGCAAGSATSIPASWLHWAPANLPGVQGQRMSQLSPAQGQRGRAAGDGAKREWDLGMLPNPTTCKDVLQVLLPVSWALQLGTVALGL